MAEGRRITRSMLNADLEETSAPPRKKLKSTDVKQYKQKTDKRKKRSTRKPKTSQKRDTNSHPNKRSQPGTVRKLLYKVVEKEVVSIKSKKDVRMCTVWSMCILDSGDVLIADFCNPLLKRMNGDTFELCEVLKLHSSANAVCQVNEEEVVMALSDRCVQFVSVQDKLIPTRLLRMNHYCLGIGVLSGNIFIGDGGNRNVFIYDMDGIRLNKIGGRSIFSWNREIVKSDDNTAIYITDRDKGLVKLKANGEVIWKCFENTFESAFGLCTDGTGNMFITGYDSKNVVQISSEGQCLGEVVPSSDCIPRTSAVCFNKRTSTMFVAGYAQNDILVCRLK